MIPAVLLRSFPGAGRGRHNFAVQRPAGAALLIPSGGKNGSAVDVIKGKRSRFGGGSAGHRVAKGSLLLCSAAADHDGEEEAPADAKEGAARIGGKVLDDDGAMEGSCDESDDYDSFDGWAGNLPSVEGGRAELAAVGSSGAPAGGAEVTSSTPRLEIKRAPPSGFQKLTTLMNLKR